MAWVFLALGLLLIAFTVTKRSRSSSQPLEAELSAEEFERREKQVIQTKVYGLCPDKTGNENALNSPVAENKFVPELGVGGFSHPPKELPRESIRENQHWESDEFSSPVMLACFNGEVMTDLDIEELEKTIPFTTPAGIDDIVSAAINKHVTEEEEPPPVVYHSAEQLEDLRSFDLGTYQ